MATQWISPTWRMPENSNQSKVDNYSLSFNGTDEYIDLTQHDLGTVNTISFWLKRANTDNVWTTIFGEPSNTFDQLIKLLETMTKRMQETELKLKQLDDKLENDSKTRV